jgi:molecular chaperone DnaJ
MRSHYASLGLEPGAPLADVKRAFRRLAMRWHPDRNPEPHAAAEFRRIRTAYDALMAAAAGEAVEVEASADTAPPPPETAARPRGADLRQELELTLEEAMDGCLCTVTLLRHQPCSYCDGSGEAGIARSRLCPHCQGSGRLRDGAGKLTKCPQCNGRGYRSERICPECNGAGRHEQAVTLQVRVPPGLIDGDELRLAGKGEASPDDGAPGHLYLLIRLLPHPRFVRHGRDLVLRQPVNALRLLAGGCLTVPGLTAPLHCELTPGRADGRALTIAGAGLPGRGNGPAGNLHIDFEPLYPEHWSDEEQAQLARLARALDERLGTDSDKSTGKSRSRRRP